ncbi:MAG: hypothetical protein WCI76_00960 [bacterium]
MSHDEDEDALKEKGLDDVDINPELEEPPLDFADDDGETDMDQYR